MKTVSIFNKAFKKNFNISKYACYHGIEVLPNRKYCQYLTIRSEYAGFILVTTSVILYSIFNYRESHEFSNLVK